MNHTNTTPTVLVPPVVTKVAKKSLQTLGGIFHYLEGTVLMVELKTGCYYLGKLLSSTSDMNLLLGDVVMFTPKDQHLLFQYKRNNIHNATSHSNQFLQYYHHIISLQPQETQQKCDATDSQPPPVTTTTSSSTTVTNDPHHQRRNVETSTTTTTTTTVINSRTESATPILPLVQIRGSKIRYIHFIDHSSSITSNDRRSINHRVQVGMHRERMAKQQYQRGVRK
jgi:small nuclear ribonucleoprotein (snRNP)-like protein